MSFFRPRALAVFALALAPLLTACAEEDDNDPIGLGPSGTPPTSPPPGQSVTATCTVSISPGRYSYTLSSGVLTLRDEATQGTSSLTRVPGPAPGELPVIGHWLIGEQIVPPPIGGTLRSVLIVQRDRILATAECKGPKSSATATAASRAIIDDTTIEVLDSDSDERTY
jgi:hypothetical protein